MTGFPILATFFSSNRLYHEWREGQLASQWYSTYPKLFDNDDLRIASTQAHLGYHFYEWLTAILLFHTQGFLSLVEKYAYRSHKRKYSVIKRFCDAASIEFLHQKGKEAMVQCPDLLVYHPDLSDWFFCEVKGPRDSLRPEQIELFREMEHTTGKDVYVVNFGELKNHRFLDNNLLTC